MAKQRQKNFMIPSGMNDMGPELPAEELPAEMPSMANGEMCVPLDALAMPGEDEQLTNPEPGDPVTFNVGGKVSRVEGSNAYVTPETVNGKPVEKAADQGPAPESGAMAELEGMANSQGYMG
jgi:hypothetical protein